MTHYLGIISAYAAVAILAWLTALLYPRLLPAAPVRVVRKRWRGAAELAAVFALIFALSRLASDGSLLAGEDPLAASANLVIVFAPILVWLALKQERAAVLVPAKGLGRSLLIGTVFSLCGIAAYFSTRSGAVDLSLPGAPDLATDAAVLVLRSALRSLVLAAFLAFVADAWSARVAVAIAGLGMAATQVPSLLQDGFTAEWLVIMLAHVALVTGALSAILATRNIVWFWPVLALLGLLQLYTG